MAKQILRPVKSLAKHLLYRPKGVSFGRNSYIRSPYVIYGASSIRIGEDTTILPHSYLNAVQEYAGIHYQPKILIGDGVYIGRHVYLVAMDEISIGEGVVLSEHVYITDLMHGLDPQRGPIMEQPIESKGPVRIGSHCFIGYRAAIMPNVVLGAHCVVGANAVVTKSFPAFSMVAGVPAKIIRTYSTEQGDWVLATC